MTEDDADSGAGGQLSVFRPLEADDPEQLGSYTLAAQLGAGGMAGRVWGDGSMRNVVRRGRSGV